MYSIQFSDWGLVLEFMGGIRPDMMRDWLADVQQLTGGLSEPFSVIVDVKQAWPSTHEVEAQLLQGLFVLEEAGMERAAVVVSETGDGPWPRLSTEQALTELRCIVVRNGADWLVEAHAWVQRGIDPQSDETARRAKP